MEKILKKTVKEVMTKKVISVSPTEDLKHLFQLMDKHGILGLPVVDEGGECIGMITESDLIRHFTTLKTPKGVHVLGSMIFLDDIRDFNKHLRDRCAETAGDLMTKSVISLSQDATMLEALNIMSKEEINRLPIVDKKGKLVGILTRTDVVHQLAKIKTP